MKTWITFQLVLIASLVGCNQRNGENESAQDPIVMHGPPPELDRHAHPSHGPNGGELIELGNDVFHAELLHESDGITIVVLDGTATQPVPISPSTLTISLRHNGEVRMFDLKASPEVTDASGKSSRFRSTDPQLAAMMDAGAVGAVVIQIEGKSYTGKISHDHSHSHDHDHEGEGHAHGDHDHHDH